MVIESPVFKKYVNWQLPDGLWQHKTKFYGGNTHDLRSKLLVELPYEIILSSEELIDLRDIDAFVQDEWSAYTQERAFKSHYFFKLEADAVAFKLRWL